MLLHALSIIIEYLDKKKRNMLCILNERSFRIQA